MIDDKTTTTRTTNQARQGSTPHVTRHVLGFGLPIAILAMLVVYLLVF